GGSALAHQEVAEWTVTTRPAQLSAAGGTVLWWGPETEAASPPVVWDQAESAALTAGGARLLEPEALAALQVEAGITGMAGARTVVAVLPGRRLEEPARPSRDRKSTRLNSSHVSISYAVFCLTKEHTSE